MYPPSINQPNTEACSQILQSNIYFHPHLLYNRFHGKVGQSVRLTRERSPVRAWVEPFCCQQFQAQFVFASLSDAESLHQTRNPHIMMRVTSSTLADATAGHPRRYSAPLGLQGDICWCWHSWTGGWPGVLLGDGRNRFFLDNPHDCCTGASNSVGSAFRSGAQGPGFEPGPFHKAQSVPLLSASLAV